MTTTTKSLQQASMMQAAHCLEQAVDTQSVSSMQVCVGSNAVENSRPTQFEEARLRYVRLCVFMMDRDNIVDAMVANSYKKYRA